MEGVRRDLDMSEGMGKACCLETAVLGCRVHVGVRQVSHISQTDIKNRRQYIG